jgi:hypothetical protein
MTGRANKSGGLPDPATLTGGLGTRTGSPAAQNVRLGAPQMVMLANHQRAHNGGSTRVSQEQDQLQKVTLRLGSDAAGPAMRLSTGCHLGVNFDYLHLPGHMIPRSVACRR